MAIPLNLKETVLKQLHDHAGHLGVRKTTSKIRERFYWPGYEQDIEAYIRESEQCQRRNPPNPRPIAPLGTIKTTEPFEKIYPGISWAPFPLVSRAISTLLWSQTCSLSGWKPLPSETLLQLLSRLCWLMMYSHAMVSQHVFTVIKELTSVASSSRPCANSWAWVEPEPQPTTLKGMDK